MFMFSAIKDKGVTRWGKYNQVVDVTFGRQKETLQVSGQTGSHATNFLLIFFPILHVFSFFHSLRFKVCFCICIFTFHEFFFIVFGHRYLCFSLQQYSKYIFRYKPWYLCFFLLLNMSSCYFQTYYSRLLFSANVFLFVFITVNSVGGKASAWEKEKVNNTTSSLSLHPVLLSLIHMSW